MIRGCVFFMAMIILPSCVFFEKPNVYEEYKNDDFASYYNDKGDSITVDATIGDYNVFYKVKELQADSDINGKVVLLNIQKTDTTSVVPYKTIKIKEFEPLIGKESIKNYFIDSFYIKEVREKSVVFHINLCMFEENFHREVYLTIWDNGSMEYKLAI